MVELEAIVEPIEVDVSQFKQGIEEAQSANTELGESVKADSAKMQKAYKEAETSQGTFADSSEKGSKKVKASSETATGSIKNLSLGSVELATAGVSLFNVMDSVEKAQYRLTQANISADRAQVALTQAQTNLNEAILKYGADSEEVRMAQERLSIAQATATQTTELQKLRQDDLNETTSRAYLTILPTLITGVDGVTRAWKGLQTLNVPGTLSKINDAIGGNGRALASAALAGGAFFAAYTAFTTSSESTRQAMSVLTGILIAAAAAQWLWNIATSYGLGLTGFGLALVGTAAVAAAGTYLLSSQYGTDINDAKSGGEGIQAGQAAGASGASYTAEQERKGMKFIGYNAQGEAMYENLDTIDRDMSSPEYFFDKSGQAVYQNIETSKGVYKYDTAKYGTLVGSQYESKLDQRIAELGMQGQQITIYVDGSADAERTADAIAQELESNGVN
jgi:hypothetical protein